MRRCVKSILLLVLALTLMGVMGCSSTEKGQEEKKPPVSTSANDSEVEEKSTVKILLNPVISIKVSLAENIVRLPSSTPNLLPSGDEQFQLPNFVGMNYDEVLANAEYNEHFKFTRTEGNDPDLPAGQIMRQTPNQGIMVKKGSEVVLQVNSKIEQVAVPYVKNYTQADAIALLKESGLKYKTENVADDEIKVGNVVSTDPPENTMVDVGSTITLKVSTGPATKKVRIPEGLEGKTLYDVTSQLEEKKLKVGNVLTDDNSTLEKDLVVSTNPAPGSEVSEGATVDIIVSSGKGAVKTVTKQISLPSSVNMDVSLKVYRNGTVVDQQTVNPAYAGDYTLSFTGKSGQENVVVQLNDQDYMYLTFNYDTQEATINQTFEFVPPSFDDNVHFNLNQ